MGARGSLGAVLLSVMGKTTGPRASGKQGSKKPRNFIPKWEYWAKAKLASCCSEDGVPFHIGPVQLESILESWDAGNQELSGAWAWA